MAAGAVAEQVATELETVAGDLEQVASVARHLDGRIITAFGVGLGVGAGVGFYVGYRYSKKKLRAEIYAEAEQEIAEVREFYQQKVIAAEAQAKPSVEDIVEEKGYSVHEDQTHIEYANLDDPAEEPDIRSIRPPGPVAPATRTGPAPTALKDPNDDWDWEIEMQKRDPAFPFIINQSEYETEESGYSQSTLIYYTTDDVLVDEADQQTILHNRERLIGNALDRFGHGADDYNTVYVRNSELELEFEIQRVKQSWEVEVLGHSPHETG